MSNDVIVEDVKILDQLEAEQTGEPSGEQAGSPSPKATPQPQKHTASTADKLAGKSLEEVSEMYRNLESHAGSLQTRVHSVEAEAAETRRLADQILQMNLNNGATAPAAAESEIDPSELLDRPGDALEGFVSPRLKQLEDRVSQRFDQIESGFAQQAFNAEFADLGNINTLAQSPEMQEYINSSPGNLYLAQQAAQGIESGDFRAASMLLRGFRDFKPTQNSAQEDASGLSLEAGGAGSAASEPAGGRTYSREKLRQLRSQDPAAYERLQPQIMKAYVEGRVKD